MSDRVAIYARVSTDEQAEKQTIENQLTACRDYCRTKGYTIAAEFRDEGVSGATPLDQRPEGKRLLAVAGDGLFSQVVVYRLDRLARDVAEGIIAYRRLKAVGTPVVSVNESWDDTPTGRLTFHLFMSFGEFERDLIRERTMAGRLRRVRNGKYQASQPPFGYRYVSCGQRKCGHGECGTLVVDEEHEHVVQMIFEWAREGTGLKAIATKLEKLGVEPPSPKHPRRQSHYGWHFSTVYKILTSPRYTGRATYGGEAMTCPAIVTPEAFRSANEALKRRKLDSSRNTKNFYLLQHLLWCRECGSRYTPRTVSDPRSGRESARAIYHCYKRARYGPRADHDGVQWRYRAEELDAKVKDAVRRLYDDPDVFMRNVDLQVERLKDEVSEQGRHVAKLERRMEELAEEETRVITLARKGYIDETQMLQQLDQVRAERQDVDHELKMARQAAADVDWVTEAADWFRQVTEQAPFVPSFHDEVTGELAEPTGEVWRDLIRRVIDRVWVEPDGSITLEGPFSTTSDFMTCR